MTRQSWLVASAFFIMFTALANARADDNGKNAKNAKRPQLESVELGTTRNVHALGKTLLFGQPTAEGFASAKERGIKVVVTLRREGEVQWDEAGTVERLGLEFHRFGFGPACHAHRRDF